ncbi:MAG: hypothetical protein ACRAS9_01750 [Mycoplasma sp.]
MKKFLITKKLLGIALIFLTSSSLMDFKLNQNEKRDNLTQSINYPFNDYQTFINKNIPTDLNMAKILQYWFINFVNFAYLPADDRFKNEIIQILDNPTPNPGSVEANILTDWIGIETTLFSAPGVTFKVDNKGVITYTGSAWNSLFGDANFFGTPVFSSLYGSGPNVNDANYVSNNTKSIISSVEKICQEMGIKNTTPNTFSNYNDNNQFNFQTIVNFFVQPNNTYLSSYPSWWLLFNTLNTDPSLGNVAINSDFSKNNNQTKTINYINSFFNNLKNAFYWSSQLSKNNNVLIEKNSTTAFFYNAYLRPLPDSSFKNFIRPSVLANNSEFYEYIQMNINPSNDPSSASNLNDFQFANFLTRGELDFSQTSSWTNNSIAFLPSLQNYYRANQTEMFNKLLINLDQITSTEQRISTFSDNVIKNLFNIINSNNDTSINYLYFLLDNLGDSDRAYALLQKTRIQQYISGLSDFNDTTDKTPYYNTNSLLIIVFSQIKNEYIFTDKNIPLDPWSKSENIEPAFFTWLTFTIFTLAALVVFYYAWMKIHEQYETKRISSGKTLGHHENKDTFDV